MVFWVKTLLGLLGSRGASLSAFDIIFETGDRSANTAVAQLPAPPSTLEADYEFSGRHLVASYSGCDMAALTDLPCLMDAMHRAVTASGATLLNAVEHHFPPHGLTAVMLLSESHASIHTYPEHAACFVDLFTCGSTCKAEAFDQVLREYLQPRHITQRILLRHHEIQDEAVRIKAA